MAHDSEIRTSEAERSRTQTQDQQSYIRSRSGSLTYRRFYRRRTRSKQLTSPSEKLDSQARWSAALHRPASIPHTAQAQDRYEGTHRESRQRHPTITKDAKVSQRQAREEVTRSVMQRFYPVYPMTEQRSPSPQCTSLLRLGTRRKGTRTWLSPSLLCTSPPPACFNCKSSIDLFGVAVGSLCSDSDILTDWSGSHKWS